MCLSMKSTPDSGSPPILGQVERLLLPGAVALWPTLLEALLVDEIGAKAGLQGGTLFTFRERHIGNWKITVLHGELW